MQGQYGNTFYELSFYLRLAGGNTNQFSIVLRYRKEDKTLGTTDESILKIEGLACKKWFYTGVALNSADGATIFAQLANTGASDETFKNAKQNWVAKSILSRASKLILFSATSIEFDDVRLYSGRVTRATFLDAIQCGHKSHCPNRAYTTPSSRRVVCVSAILESQSTSTYSNFACTNAMYYDSSAVDVAAIMSTSGVSFTFRDTAWEELSFEILRKSAADADSTADFETVILVDTNLKGCAAKFTSLTYMDLEAGRQSNLEWFYKIRTKTDSGDFLSQTHYFKSPWIADVSGDVNAGGSDVPVQNVRVCTDFSAANGTLIQRSDRPDVIVYGVLHTSSIKKTADENAYVVADGIAKGEASHVDVGEYLTANLVHWTSVSTIEVCVKPQDRVPKLIAYVNEVDSGSSNYHGHPCKYAPDLLVTEKTHQCLFYTCSGTSVPTFHGQYVTVLARESVDVTEIFVRGETERCTFSAVTDESGDFDISVLDTSGIPSQKTNLAIGAYKEEIFPETD